MELIIISLVGVLVMVMDLAGITFQDIIPLVFHPADMITISLEDMLDIMLVDHIITSLENRQDIIPLDGAITLQVVVLVDIIQLENVMFLLDHSLDQITQLVAATLFQEMDLVDATRLERTIFSQEIIQDFPQIDLIKLLLVEDLILLEHLILQK